MPTIPSLGLALTTASVGGGAAFSPAALSGLLGWHRADRLYTAGAPATWNNSASGSPLTLDLRATVQPSNAIDAGYNNQAVVSFDSTDDPFTPFSSTSTAVTGLTVFVVGEPGAGAVVRDVFSTSDNGNEVDVYVDAAGLFGIYRGAIVNGPAWSGKQAGVGVFRGTVGEVYLSKKSAPATGAITAVAGIGAPYCIGDYLLGSGAAWKGSSGTGKIAEVAVYGRALSAAEVALLLDYAGTRYAIAVAA